MQIMRKWIKMENSKSFYNFFLHSFVLFLHFFPFLFNVGKTFNLIYLVLKVTIFFLSVKLATKFVKNFITSTKHSGKKLHELNQEDGVVKVYYVEKLLQQFTIHIPGNINKMTLNNLHIINVQMLSLWMNKT